MAEVREWPVKIEEQIQIIIPPKQNKDEVAKVRESPVKIEEQIQVIIPPKITGHYTGTYSGYRFYQMNRNYYDRYNNAYVTCYRCNR